MAPVVVFCSTPVTGALRGPRHHIGLFCHHYEILTHFHQETVHQNNTNMTEAVINCFRGMSDLRDLGGRQTIPFPKDITGKEK